MSERMRVEHFEQLINEPVEFSAGEIGFTATIKLVDILSRQPEQTMPPFSVVFSTDHTEAFEQKTYTMQHPVLGEHLIFLVPIGPDETGMRYEAVFA